MAGFFSLGGREQDPQTEININNNNNSSSNNNSFLLFKNQEIYNKGFELWQQYYQLHHHQQQRHDHDVVDFSIGPSRRNDVVSSSGDESYRSAPGLRAVRQGRGGGGGGADGINCQDCGNQAKKDCVHLRCRTCCKSRGFDCQTHVKSTWVPAAKRRERLQQQQQLAVREENPKRIREDHGGSTAALACTAAAGFELGNFPAEVNSPAVFRCVRVSAVDDAAEHYAYQTAVNIAGHVFKGILYDQGRYGGGESSSGSQQQQPLDLIAAAATSSAAATSNAHMTMLESSAYPTPLNAFMAGTQFFPPPRS